MTITIKQGKPERGDVSTPKKINDREYVITYHKELDGLLWVQAMFVDLIWCLMDAGLPITDSKRRDRFLMANLNSFRRHYKKFWIGEG